MTLDGSTSAPTGFMPMSPDCVHDELVSVVQLLQKHIARLNDGLPGIDKPGDPEALGPLLTELVGEVYYAAGKLETLARVLNGEGR